MCGICGWLSFTGADVDRAIVKQMAGTLVHRGPDDDGFFFDVMVALGQRRLSIIDVAGGHQPMPNEDRSIWVTYNGEIYNFPELVEDLTRRGHRFRTRSDTEVIVHAYEEYGLDCLERFNGMYAFALWDGRTKRLVLARDPFGIKPVYVWRDGSHLLFASEVKAFLSDPSFPREIDLAALDRYLTFQFVPSPGTIFKGVQKLQPGHCLVVDEDGQTRVIPFARKAPVIREVINEASAVSELQNTLAGAVKRQMISDVPVGAMLSGGVDSAAVVALMQQSTNQRVKTFTVGFVGDFAKNELKAARRSAAILGTDHYEIAISAQDCLDVFPKVVWHLDEPVATPSALAMFWVSQLASQHVKVVLTGQGADEPWAGYRRYEGEKWGQIYRHIPLFLRQQVVAPLAENVPRAEALKRAVYALGTDDPAQRFTGVYAVFTPLMKRALYRPEVAEAIGPSQDVESIRYWQSPVAHLDPLAQQLYVETRFSLADNFLLYGDKMAMASSLEARVPLLDLPLMSFVESLPVQWRLRGLNGHKYLYRKAIARWLPDEILRRPKIGFATPIDGWFQDEITGYVRERLLGTGSLCAQLFDQTCLEAMINEHAARRKDFSRALYSLLVLAEWAGSFCAGA